MSTDCIEKNKVVSIKYRILDEQGNVVEQSDIPIDYIHGVDGRLFEKIEAELDGKCVGDFVQVVLNPTEGFGEHDPTLTFTDDLHNVPQEYRYVGAKPTFQNEQGEVQEFVVSKIENGKLTVDANHPFAGKTVTFNIDVVSVRSATQTELNGEQVVHTPPRSVQ